MKDTKVFDVKQCSIGAAVLYAIENNTLEIWEEVLSRPDFPKDVLIDLLVRLSNGKLVRCLFKESGYELLSLMKEGKGELESLLSIFGYLYPEDDSLWEEALGISRVYNYFCELSETVLFEKYSNVKSAYFARQMYLMHPVL